MNASKNCHGPDADAGWHRAGLKQQGGQMSILQPNLEVPFNITRLSHVVLTSADLDKTRFFYESGLGLEVTAHDAERLCLRAIEESGHHSIVFEGAARRPGTVSTHWLSHV